MKNVFTLLLVLCVATASFAQKREFTNVLITSTLYKGPAVDYDILYDYEFNGTGQMVARTTSGYYGQRFESGVFAGSTPYPGTKPWFFKGAFVGMLDVFTPSYLTGDSISKIPWYGYAFSDSITGMRPRLGNYKANAGLTSLKGGAFDIRADTTQLADSAGVVAVTIIGGSVGIGTAAPLAKLTVADGDIYITDISTGIIGKSPDGTCYRATFANGGTWDIQAITCPTP